YAAVQRAVAAAAEGRGPTLIESLTYRIEAHTNADDATRYRDQAEVDGWLARDPLARIRRHLLARGLLDEPAITALDAEAEADALSEDETVLVFGEDVGPLGGVFRITDGLAAKFGEARVFDTPLAESGIVGTAIGMAMNGLRPVVEMQFDAFAYPAFEQIVSH